MKKRSKYILAGTVILAFLIIAIHFANTRTFKGRVIDTDTKEPIEGAVVVAAWYKARDTIAGESTSLKDVKECLTDKNGKWWIRGPKGRPPGHGPMPPLSLFFSYIREPVFIVFKPGYCSWPNGFSIDACKNRIRITGDKDEGIGGGGTLELPKLTKREDRVEAQSLQLPLGPGSLEKMKELIRLLNEEGRNLGLGEIYK
jgi:hypothetical protein